MEKKNFLLNLTAIVCAIFIIILIISGCGNPDEELDINPSEFRVISIGTYYDKAYKNATKWQDDAYLDYVLSTFAMPFDHDRMLTINYGFRSRSNPGKWFSVVFTTTNPVQIKLLDGEYSEGNERPLTQEIEVAQLPFDNLDALIIAYQSGGNDFLQVNNGIDSDSFVELQQENEALGTGRQVWIVTFSADRFKTMYVTLDSITGEVLDVWRNDE